MRTTLAFALLFVTACGSNDTGAMNPDAAGGGGCVTSDDCPAGQTCDPATGVCGGGGCTSDDQCGGATPACRDDGQCVECVSSDDCPVETPLCEASECVEGCAGTDVTADFVMRPSDIIWVVDQSGSMDQETQYVQQRINDFAALIDSSGIDYRVVMIADPTANNAICVPPPLAGPMCDDNVRFRLVPEEVGSNDGPQLAVQTYDQYSDFLRPDSLKHFVFVTDDDSNWSAMQFTDAVLALPPTDMFAGFKVHGIYAFGTPGDPDGCDGPFGSGAAEGTVYTELIAQTMGASGVICTGDWTQVFDDITAAVVAGSQVSCELVIPPPPMGETLDPTKVNVRYLAGGVAPGVTIGRVDTAADCGADGGWYYDDNAAPTMIILCPATCTEVQSDQAANIQVEFGCSTILE